MNFKLVNGTAQPIPAGVYNVKANMTAGTTAVSYTVLDESPTEITEVTATADADGTVELGACTLHPVITGDATLIFNRIRS